MSFMDRLPSLPCSYVFQFLNKLLTLKSMSQVGLWGNEDHGGDDRRHKFIVGVLSLLSSARQSEPSNK